MEQNQNYYPVQEEEEGIDILAMVKRLWDGRKTIIICTVVFMVLGLVAALTMKRTYSVTTIMVPQMSSGGGSSSLSSLASLAGIDLTKTPSAELSPITYPQIVSSVPFRLELMYAPLHYAKADTAVSMMDYSKNYMKPTVMGTIKKYTIGLPGVIMGAIRKEKPEVTLPEDGSSNDPKPLVLTDDESKMLEVVGQSVSLDVNKKEGFLTLSVNGSEPIQTAELAIKAQQLLQKEIVRFRTEKAEKELEYVQARYDEIRVEANNYQTQLAAIKDRSQNMMTTRSQIEMERVQAKYSIANSIHLDIAKQLEQAKMQVKKDTPSFTIVQPVTVPNRPSNSRAKTLVIWTFFGIILGCGIVLVKDYLPKIKEMFQSAGSKEE